MNNLMQTNPLTSQSIPKIRNRIATEFPENLRLNFILGFQWRHTNCLLHDILNLEILISIWIMWCVFTEKLMTHIPNLYFLVSTTSLKKWN